MANHNKHKGRPNHDTCRAGLHEWTKENWHMRKAGPTCILCKRDTQRASRRRLYKRLRTMIGPYGFNIARQKVEAVLRITIHELRSMRDAAKESGVGYTTVRKIYWAERDRRRMMAR